MTLTVPSSLLIGNANWQTVLQVRICESSRVVQGMAGCPVEGLVYLLIEADTRILGIIHLPEAPYLDAGIMRPDQDPGHLRRPSIESRRYRIARRKSLIASFLVKRQ
jgi:hypothetical protein